MSPYDFYCCAFNVEIFLVNHALDLFCRHTHILDCNDICCNWWVSFYSVMFLMVGVVFDHWDWLEAGLLMVSIFLGYDDKH